MSVPAADAPRGGARAQPEFDPYAWEFHEDPYPTYRWLRDAAPAYRNERLGFWALSRYETLRYDASSQILGRTVRGELTLHGQTMHDGERVLLLIGAANRDERAFAHPDVYDVRRDASAHLGFGRGTHFCLGASLARLEARVALEAVCARLPDFEIEARGLVRVHSVNVRGFAAMPIEFTPAG